MSVHHAEIDALGFPASDDFAAATAVPAETTAARLQRIRQEGFDNAAAKERRMAAFRKGERTKATNKAAKIEAFNSEHAELVAWMNANATWCSFAANMLQTIQQWGGLTENQLAAIERTRAKAEDRAAKAAEREASAPQANTADIEGLFAQAASAGKKRLALYLGDFVLKPAPLTGKNPGAIYATKNGEYVGKVQGGKVFSRYEAESVAAAINGITSIDDLKLRGKQTGRCCCCGAELENAESIRKGIGPICEAKWS